MTFDDLEFKSRTSKPLFSEYGFCGSTARLDFPNGYGVSVIDDGYGSDKGLYELAVLKGGSLTYDTPITDDVLGYLTKEDVTRHMAEVAALPTTESSS